MTEGNDNVLEGITQKLMTEARERTEQKIIDFFGSEEEAREFAPMYVIEIGPVMIETEYTEDGVKTTAQQYVNIRAKTREELYGVTEEE